jgi:hypothetical protein
LVTSRFLLVRACLHRWRAANSEGPNEV